MDVEWMDVEWMDVRWMDVRWMEAEWVDEWMYVGGGGYTVWTDNRGWL